MMLADSIRMTSIQIRKLPSHYRLYAVGMCVGLCLALGACTKSSSLPGTQDSTQPIQEQPSKPSPHVETQLLETLETAESLGQGNPLLMSSLYSLAMYYQEQGEIEKAEFQYKRALALKEEVSGPEHPDVATILNKYAGLLRTAHRYQEAENLSARAHAIMAKQSSLPSSP